MALTKVFFKEMRDSWWEHLRTWMILAPISILLVTGIWFLSGLPTVMARLASTEVYTIYLMPSVDPENYLRDLKTQLKGPLLHFSVVNQDQVLDQAKSRFPDVTEELISFGEEMKNLIPAYISVQGTLSTEQIKWIKNQNQVEDLRIESQLFEEAFTFFKAGRALLVMTLVVLFLASAMTLSWYPRFAWSALFPSLHWLRRLGSSGIQPVSLLALHGLIMTCVAALMGWAFFYSALIPMIKGLPLWMPLLAPWEPAFDSRWIPWISTIGLMVYQLVLMTPVVWRVHSHVSRTS